MTSVERLVLIDLSSDEEDGEIIIKREDKKMSVSSIRRAKGFSVVEVLTKEEKTREDDECCILTFDPYDSHSINCRISIDHHKVKGGPEEDLVILAEKGKVALKDYPHSRFQCGEFPFDKTPHESFCAQCYCYACDVAAPCLFWTALYSGHCDASDKEEKWNRLRLCTVLNRSLRHN